MVRRMTLGVLGATALLHTGSIVAAPAPDAIGDARAQLRDAKAQSLAARMRAAALDRQASAERNEAKRAVARQAAVAARIQRAEADISAAEARIVIVRRLLAEQRARLAARQGPTVRLVAALQSLARRPAIVSVMQPGTVADLVHVRTVFATVLPVVQARTASLRQDLARTRQLEADGVVAVKSLADGRNALAAQRVALARLEAEHRLKSRQLGRSALFESDRAIALGEQARDIADLMTQLGDSAGVRADLESLPVPLQRPVTPGDASLPESQGRAFQLPPPYRLPVDGQLITGFGEVSDAGVRSRGLTIQPRIDAQVVAPAAGRIVFARRFRSYGMVVIIDHGGGWTSLIANLGDASVSVGDTVDQGSPVGRAGESGDRHVTVELRRRDRPIDLTRLLG